MADLAVALQVGQGAERLLDRHAMIDGVKLVELDPVEPQPLQALLADPPQMRGPAVDRPAPRTGTREPALARDHQPWRVGVERLGDQCLADTRPIGIGGVDKGDSFVDVAGRPPYAGAADAHRAQAEPADSRPTPQGQRHRQMVGSAVVGHDRSYLGMISVTGGHRQTYRSVVNMPV